VARHIVLGGTQEIPLIFEVDALVIGGGLTGLAVGSDLAGSGWRVALVESETFLGYELSAWQRPWLEWRDADAELLRSWFPLEGRAEAGEGECVPLPMNSLKIALEDRLLQQGVQLLYASRPVSYSRDADRWLVAIGNKSGRQAIAATYIVDATDHGAMAFLAGQGTTEAAELVRRTIEFTGVPRADVQPVAMPPALGIPGDSVTVYPGAFSESHVYVDVPVRLSPPVGRSTEEDLRAELLARLKSLEVAEYLTGNVPAFAEARLGLGSLHVMRYQEFDPAAALRHGSALAKDLLSGGLANGDCQHVGAFGRRAFALGEMPVAKEAGSAVGYREQSDFAEAWAGAKVAIPMASAPVLSDVDVAVIGGGTSGAPAAYMAGREGASVALVEMNSRLGGTGTLGGICEHWMSTPNAFCDEIDERVERWEDRVRYPAEARRFAWYRTDSKGNRYLWGGDRHWSIEIKEQVFEEMCREANVSLLFNCLLCGTLVQGDTVLGALVATPYGPRTVLGRIVVDATGDGDVAAFAGADHVYGNDRDRLTQWTALAFYRSPAALGNNHMEAGDISDVFDYTRFILTNRRRAASIHDHGNYVAPRESRHILGETTVSLIDQLMLRTYPDTIVVMFSNWDMKGLWFADIVDFGINPPHEDIDIPYRSLIPRRLEQLIVAGKAFSLTHDACAAPRMQRDIILLGGAVGLAAAFAAREAVSPRNLQVGALQRRLVETGNAPERLLHYAPPEPPNLEALIAGLTGEEPLEWQEMLATEKATSVSPVIQLCCADTEAVVPLLQAAFRSAEGARRLLLARLLLWHGCGDGADTVYDEIVRQLGEVPGLPRRTGDIDWSTGSPEQAIQPEIIFLVNGLIRIEDPRVHGLASEFARRIAQTKRDYRDIRAGIFDYIRMVATAAERQPRPEFVPALKQLLDLPEVRAAVCPEELVLDYFEERRAYLPLSLSRALARCGRKAGLLTLAQLVGDSRAIYASSAHQELRALTGLDLPRDSDRWIEALQGWPKSFAPTPRRTAIV